MGDWEPALRCAGCGHISEVHHDFAESYPDNIALKHCSGCGTIRPTTEVGTVKRGWTFQDDEFKVHKVVDPDEWNES